MKYLLVVLLVLSGCAQDEKLALAEEKIAKHDEGLRIAVLKREELKRVNDTAQEYLNESVTLSIDLHTSNNFDDRRERPCISGVIANNGDEIIQSLDVVVRFHDPDGDEIGLWETRLYSAIGSTFDDNPRLKYLLTSNGAQREMIGPGEKIRIHGKCMREPPIGWDISFAMITRQGVSLSPKY